MLTADENRVSSHVDARSFCEMFEMIGITNISVSEARGLMSQIDSSSNGLFLENMSYEQFCYSVKLFRETRNKLMQRIKVPHLPKDRLKALLLPVPWQL